MIFLADILTDGSYPKTDKIKKERSATTQAKKKNIKKNKKKSSNPKNSGLTKLANKTAGVKIFTEGEIAIVKSMVANDVKTPLNGGKGKQKTIGAKKGIKYHRSI